MNIQQAKAIPMQELLARLGRQPVKAIGADLWYLSPFRVETTPSFKVNTERNIWFDFGEGSGGNILDFVMKISGVATSTAALIELTTMLERSIVPAAIPPPPASDRHAAPAQSTRDEGLIRPLQHQALLSYLHTRGISVEIARPYVEEIHYLRQGKRYFALAFKNARGGYELRNAYFKGTHGPKDVTLIPPVIATDAVLVFEGFLDFLSALVCDVLPNPRPFVLVLNSNALRERAIAVIQAQGVSRVDLYLDHDQSGRELTAYFERVLAGVDVTDRSALYAGHQDMNDFLISRLDSSGR